MKPVDLPKDIQIEMLKEFLKSESKLQSFKEQALFIVGMDEELYFVSSDRWILYGLLLDTDIHDSFNDGGYGLNVYNGVKEGRDYWLELNKEWNKILNEEI